MFFSNKLSCLYLQKVDISDALKHFIMLISYALQTLVEFVSFRLKSPKFVGCWRYDFSMQDMDQS